MFFQHVEWVTTNFFVCVGSYCANWNDCYDRVVASNLNDSDREQLDRANSVNWNDWCDRFSELNLNDSDTRDDFSTYWVSNDQVFVVLDRAYCVNWNDSCNSVLASNLHVLNWGIMSLTRWGSKTNFFVCVGSRIFWWSINFSDYAQAKNDRLWC